jgi:hypothetical protein
MQRSIGLALCGAVLVLAGCGGAEPPTTAPQPRQFTAPPPLDATTLLDWAETQYPKYFPVHATDRSATVGPDVYTYRAYQVNGKTNLVGVTADGRIDVLLPDATGAAPFTVGTLTAFTCRVLPQNCLTSVSGTAAAGGAMGGATVTLKDSAGNTVAATATPSGTYTLNTTGLTGPFLLQATTPGGASLYGVTAHLATATVANLTPLTDLIVRSWYSLHNVSADTAFADPAGHPAPTVQQASAVAETVLSVMQLALNNGHAGITVPLELIEKPFVADHTGLDGVLDATSIVYGNGALLNVSSAATHQTSTITYNAGSGSITAASTTYEVSDFTTNSTSLVSAVIPLQTAQSDALNAITAVLNSLANLVNARGASLTTADLAGMLDPILLNDGLNRDQLAADMVATFNKGQTLALVVKGIKSLELVNGRAEVEALVSQTAAGQTSTDDTSFFFHRVNGVWMLAGNNRRARIQLFAAARTDQGALPNASYDAINVDVKTVQGAVNAVRVVSVANILRLSPGAAVVDPSGVILDSFQANTGPLAGSSLPPAGSLCSVILTSSAGIATTAVSDGVPLNSVTTEPVPLITPTGSTLADAHLGGTLDVSWKLPTTYAVRQIELSALAFTASQGGQGASQCESPHSVTGPSATSAAISVPATCNGKPVASVNVNLSITGVNGERSQTVYTMK